MKIHEWIIENLDLANSLGNRGLILVEMGENCLNFQQMDYPVEYSRGKYDETLIRIDHIYKPLGYSERQEEAINELAARFGVSYDRS